MTACENFRLYLEVLVKNQDDYQESPEEILRTFDEIHQKEKCGCPDGETK